VRILFVKTSSLGDVVHNCPAVSDVARAHPQASIDWLVEESFVPIARRHRAVRRVIPVAWRRWRQALWKPSVWAEIRAFRAALARERYDAVIDTQGLVKSALVARMAHGARHHGFDGASAREPLAARFYDRTHAVDRSLHAVERNRALAAAALEDRVESGCDYGLRVDQVAAAAALSVDGLRAPYCVLLTMTSRDDKLWPEDRWGALLQSLAQRGMQCVLPWGSEAESARAQRLARAAPGCLVPPRLSIDALAQLMHSARAVVGVDTGLSHLAVAMGASTVGLYCATDPVLTGLYGSNCAINLGAPAAPPRVEAVVEALDALWR